MIDITGAEMLDRLASTLHERGVTLALARQTEQTRDVLRRASDDDDPTLQVYPTVSAAVAALEPSAR